jgi:hypothetical protein
MRVEDETTQEWYNTISDHMVYGFYCSYSSHFINRELYNTKNPTHSTNER